MLPDPLATPSIPWWAEQSGSAAAFSAGLNHVVLAPVIVDGLVVAVVTFGMCGDRPLWDDDELATLAEIARLAGVAVGHGLSYQRTRESALVLQRSLLTEPAQVAGLEICVRYQPAGRDEVGGDWYDAFEHRPDQLALVIGDVVGHDITAAASMGQLRTLLRGLVVDRADGPGAALDRLDTINTQLGITTFATLIHAHLTRPDTGDSAGAGAGWTLRWATAGHPPPLLITPGAAPRLLDQATGAALTRAVSRAATGPRTDTEITMAPGSTLLLYTDGLIERRGTDMDDNLAAVAAHAGVAAHQPIDQLCDGLLRDAPRSDDVALLAVRVLP